MKAIIVAGGARPSLELLKSEFNEDSIIICADSGGECLYEYGIVPKYLIGDFDSISRNVLKFFFNCESCIIEKYPKDKDFTDTELALNKAISLEADEIVFLGCIGSRIDHILGNLGLLKVCLKHNVKAVIKDEHNEIFLANKSIDLKKDDKKYFSIQAFGAEIKKLSIIGAKFDLKDYDLTPGDPLTVSNEFIGIPVHISFNEGLLLVMYCND